MAQARPVVEHRPRQRASAFRRRRYHRKRHHLSIGRRQGPLGARVCPAASSEHVTVPLPPCRCRPMPVGACDTRGRIVSLRHRKPGTAHPHKLRPRTEKNASTHDRRSSIAHEHSTHMSQSSESWPLHLVPLRYSCECQTDRLQSSTPREAPAPPPRVAEGRRLLAGPPMPAQQSSQHARARGSPRLGKSRDPSRHDRRQRRRARRRLWSGRDCFCLNASPFPR